MQISVRISVTAIFNISYRSVVLDERGAGASSTITGECVLIEWEYRKISLSDLPRKRDDIDVLNDAGSKGWELIAILPNSMAYMKREVADELSERLAHSNGATTTGEHGDTLGIGNGASMGTVSAVKAKYRDPKTNETWSGRGRMATWLKRKQDAGEDIDAYLV
jgi:DNA-binding protein H-NS